MRWRALGALGTLVLATVLSGCRDRWGSELVSVDEAGTDAGNGMSPDGVLSSDGTKVAFATLGSDFGPRDTNGNADVYVRDLATGVTTLVSVNGAGTDSSDHVSSTPVFSPDATKVAFSSHASNLGPTDTNGVGDIYLRDLVTGSTTLVSVNAAGTDAGHHGADSARFSPDGTRILFRGSGDYVAGDVGGSNIYVRDLEAGTTTRATVAAPGATGGGGGGLFGAVFSPDGTAVAFVSENPFVPRDTNNRSDVYLRDLVAQTTTLVSVNATGTNGANDISDNPIFSPDGTKIAFICGAANLGPTDTNRAYDTYVRDLASGTTTSISVNAAGTDSGNGPSGGHFWDATGTKIVFASQASNLGPTDTHVGKDVYIRDLSTGTTSLVSANADGSDSGNLASEPYAYANGKVLFSSGASDLGPNDTNGQLDLYLASVVPHA